MFSELLVTAVALTAAVCAVVYLAKFYATEMRLGNERALSELRAVTQRLLVLQGLNPHVVDPKTFGPTGMSREAEEAQAAQAAAEREAVSSDEEEALREAEDEFFRRREEALIASGLPGASSLGNQPRRPS